MTSASACSRKLTVAGVKIDLDRYAVWQRHADGTVTRVRHRDDLVPEAAQLVVLKTASVDAAAAARAFDDPSALPAAWRVPRHTAAPVTTHQGGPGHLRDHRSALILGTLGTWKGADTFYETDDDRTVRLRNLVQHATLSDPDWVRDLLPFVRSEGNMRTVAVHAAIDAAAVGHPDAAALIADTLQRADEPAVALQYWLDTYGRTIPGPVRKGIATAAARLYSERTALRYGNPGHNRTSAADVINLTHPTPTDPTQAALFGYLTAKSGAERAAHRSSLPMYTARAELKAVPLHARRELLDEARRASRSAVLARDTSHRSPFALAGFSTAELVAWLQEAEPETGKVPALRVARREALAQANEAHKALKSAKSALAAHLAAAHDRFRHDTVGVALADAHAARRAAAARLQDAKAARRACAKVATVNPAWERDPQAASALHDARIVEAKAYAEYTSALSTYRLASRAFKHAVHDSVPDALVAARDKAETAVADSNYRLTNATNDLREARQAGTTADVWETMLPSMGYMELLRNVRNLEQAGVDPALLQAAAGRLADDDQIRASRQMPMRFWSAAKALSGSPTFEAALERGVEVSTEAVPALPGRTLVLVDQSGSMQTPYGGYRDIGDWDRRDVATLAEVAALYGAALAKRSDDVDVVAFGSSHERLDTTGSVLDTVRRHGNANLGGTQTWSALNASFAAHDRVIILSDGQAHDHGQLPEGVPVHFFDLTGHGVTFAPEDSPNYYTYGGLSDLSFRLFGIMEGRADAASELLDQERSTDSE
jgi:hypothetical protein